MASLGLAMAEGTPAIVLLANPTRRRQIISGPYMDASVQPVKSTSGRMTHTPEGRHRVPHNLGKLQVPYADLPWLTECDRSRGEGQSGAAAA